MADKPKRTSQWIYKEKGVIRAVNQLTKKNVIE
jgi:hypothetical protein